MGEGKGGLGSRVKGLGFRFRAGGGGTARLAARRLSVLRVVGGGQLVKTSQQYRSKVIWLVRIIPHTDIASIAKHHPVFALGVAMLNHTLAFTITIIALCQSNTAAGRSALRRLHLPC